LIEASHACASPKRGSALYEANMKSVFDDAQGFKVLPRLMEDG
jgi:hypothetical protein